MTTERIEELQEMKDEYILNESIVPDPCSWGELAEAQADAEQCWNNTAEGKELIALQHLQGNEKAEELYYALKNLLTAYDSGQDQTGSESAHWKADNLIYTLEKED